MGHLNGPTKGRSAWGRFWMWVYGEGGLRPIESFHQTQVVSVDDGGVAVRFDDGRTYEADLIVLATGYEQSFPFLDDVVREEFRDERLRPGDGRGREGECGRARPRGGLPAERALRGRQISSTIGLHRFRQAEHRGHPAHERASGDVVAREDAG